MGRRVRPVTEQCTECGAEFFTGSSTHKTCSRECARTRRNRIWREKRAARNADPYTEVSKPLTPDVVAHAVASSDADIMSAGEGTLTQARAVWKAYATGLLS